MNSFPSKLNSPRNHITQTRNDRFVGYLMTMSQLQRSIGMWRWSGTGKWK